ncbi:PEP-CTERM sorting domain-containing protein [Blastopirellula retiformator]|nr:PEP-CTERM sorting domain-containing protein [Blastopirellula retiformator]
MSLIDPGLSGSTQYDEWTNTGLIGASNPGFPGFPGSGAWPSPIGSDAVGSGDATLNKTANGSGGGPFPSGSSMYFGGFSSAINNDGGTLQVADATPVANLQTVSFQVQIGEAWTYDFFDDILPTLSYNGGSQDLAATTSLLLEQYDNGTVTMPSGEETVYINTYLLTWDLSSIIGTISDFAIDFTGVQHATLFTLRLDQSDQPVATPEPGSLALLLGGIPAAIWCLRRRRNANAELAA